MALNFPNSPTDGQVYTDSTTGNRYLWDNSRQIWKWTPNTVSLTVSTTTPGSPVSGQLWFNSNLGRLLIYYVDGDSSQWIDAVPYNGQATLAFDAANTVSNKVNTTLIRAATIDFGDRPVYSNSFNVTDSQVTTNSRIIATCSSENLGVAGVFAGDEMEMDQFFVSANVATNGFITFSVTTDVRTGPLKGKRNILYTVTN